MIWINNLTTECVMNTHMLAVCEYDRLITFRKITWYVDGVRISVDSSYDGDEHAKPASVFDCF